MTDKFVKYMSTEERMKDFSQYVHENMKIIHTKMLSEMRRKLDMGEPDMSNSNGYLSLMVSTYGRMFNEIVYGCCGICQSTKIHPREVINLQTLRMLVSLLEGKNPLNGLPRLDVNEDKENFQRLYLECIDDLRRVKEGLPK